MSQQRALRPQHLAEPPSEEEQLLHLMFPTRIGAQHVWHIEQGKIQQLRDDGVKAGEVPIVSLTLQTHVQLEQMATLR